MRYDCWIEDGKLVGPSSYADDASHALIRVRDNVSLKEALEWAEKIGRNHSDEGDSGAVFFKPHDPDYVPSYRDERIRLCDRVCAAYVGTSPTYDEIATYNAVMAYYCRKDIAIRVRARIAAGDPKLTADTIGTVILEAEPVEYDEFDDRMADAYWERVDARIDEVLGRGESQTKGSGAIDTSPETT